jgi:hypothetical protein
MIGGPAPKAPEQIGPPKEQPKKMPEGAGTEPPLKIGGTGTPNTTVIVEPEIKTPF